MTRQEYYEHLCELGLHELIAATMAAQATKHARTKYESYTSPKFAIYCFEVWNKTWEGDDFWSYYVGVV
jgi:hypothetical protein